MSEESNSSSDRRLEAIDESAVTNNNRNRHGNNIAPLMIGDDDEDEDAAFQDKNVPPLSSLVSTWQFWWKFAIWPLVFYAMNGVIFGTLLVFDELEFNNRRDQATASTEDNGWDYSTISTRAPGGYSNNMNRRHSRHRNQNTYLSMLRFNATVFALVLAIDAVIFYLAARAVQTQVQALEDEIDNTNTTSTSAQQDTSSGSGSGSTSAAAPTNGELNCDRHEHVHGQVSRKLDAILGRRPRLRMSAEAAAGTSDTTSNAPSILVSLLWLACVLCLAFGLAFAAEWTFTWTATAQNVCKSRFFGYYNDMEMDMSASRPEPAQELPEPIAGIPAELQEWARRRYDYAPSLDFVKLKDQTSIVLSRDPRKNQAKEKNNKYDYWDPQVMVAIHADGSTQFFTNVIQPRSTIRLVPANGVDDPLSAYGFCSLYDTYKTDSADTSSSSQRNYPIGVALSMLCVDPSDYVALKTKGVFRNVTLMQYENNENNDEKGSERYSDDMYAGMPVVHATNGSSSYAKSPRYLASTSIKWHANFVWVMMTYQDSSGLTMEYYKVSVSMDGKPLQLVSVGNRSDPFPENESFTHETEEGEVGCTRRRNLLQQVALAISFVGAYIWLSRRLRLSVGVVPLVLGLVTALACLDTTLATVMASLVAVAAFVTLQGCARDIVASSAIGVVLSSEEMVWILYAALVAAANVGSPNFEETCLFTFLACTVVGTLLGHPALYLAGWAGGIGAVLVGLFWLVTTTQSMWAVKALCVGMLGGPGCVTVGLFVMQYRVYVTYYVKRAWKSVLRRGGGSSSGSTRSSNAGRQDESGSRSTS